ncbi:MAG TPA: hypothetical protein VK191_01595 [Symbiobacteriaceae bacterium]|nr:hypothetical protein [Symbiobacteriaceae bacterium]
MNLFQQYLTEAITHLSCERFNPGLTALRQTLLLRPQSPTAHRALLTCCFALGRSADALYHGRLFTELAGDGDDARLAALLGRAGIAYAESLATFGIAEAVGFQQGALGRLRQACAMSGSDPLLRVLLHVEESVPLFVAPADVQPLHLHYHDPFIAWAGPANRRAYWERLTERCDRESHLVRYTSSDLLAGALSVDRPVTAVAELADLPIIQIWEMTAPLGLEEGRPLRTLTFIQPADGPMQILVEPWLDRLSARREILLAWDAALSFAA